MPVLGGLGKSKQNLVLVERVAPLLAHKALKKTEATVELLGTLLLKIAGQGQVFVDTEEVLIRQGIV